jgi:hypothetical protein
MYLPRFLSFHDEYNLQYHYELLSLSTPIYLQLFPQCFVLIIQNSYICSPYSRSAHQFMVHTRIT